MLLWQDLAWASAGTRASCKRLLSRSWFDACCSAIGFSAIICTSRLWSGFPSHLSGELSAVLLPQTTQSAVVPALWGVSSAKLTLRDSCSWDPCHQAVTLEAETGNTCCIPTFSSATVHNVADLDRRPCVLCQYLCEESGAIGNRWIWESSCDNSPPREEGRCIAVVPKLLFW